MSLVQRLGWLLLGLLLLASVVHAPMHLPGNDCGPFSLCGNGLALMWCTAMVLVLVLLGLVRVRGLEAAQVAVPVVLRIDRGRAPPWIR